MPSAEAKKRTFDPTPESKKAIMRDRRAKAIAAMGLVERAGDGFNVSTATFRGRRTIQQVTREAGRVVCTCKDFEERSAAGVKVFRCEHILAVKYFLLGKAAKVAAEPAVDIGNQPLEEKQRMSKRGIGSGAAKRATAGKDEAGAETVQAKEAASNESVEARSDGVVLPFTNTLKQLSSEIDPNLVKTREGWRDRNGNTHMVEYVEWHTVADILDRIAPTWAHSVRNVTQIGDMVAVTAAITIDGVTREGVGTGTADSEMGIKKAEHDALKRAAVKFGIARALYQRESEVIEKEGAAAQSQFPRDPLAKSMADLVTPKQLGMIRALAREASVDVEEECQSVLRCKTDELSKRAASSFIDHLKGLEREAASGMRRAS